MASTSCSSSPSNSSLQLPKWHVRFTWRKGWSCTRLSSVCVPTFSCYVYDCDWEWYNSSCCWFHADHEHYLRCDSMDTAKYPNFTKAIRSCCLSCTNHQTWLRWSRLWPALTSISANFAHAQIDSKSLKNAQWIPQLPTPHNPQKVTHQTLPNPFGMNKSNWQHPASVHRLGSLQSAKSPHIPLQFCRSETHHSSADLKQGLVTIHYIFNNIHTANVIHG